MKTRHKRHFLRSSARCRLTPTASMIARAAIGSALTLPLALSSTMRPAHAQPDEPPQPPRWAAVQAGPGLTLRYIFLVLVPQPEETAEEKKAFPSGLLSMNDPEGGSLGLGPTVEAYVKSLKAQGAQHYDVRVIAAGDATPDSDGVYSIQTAPNPDARLYHGAISDSVRLTRVKPGVIHMIYTGQISWMQPGNGSNTQPGRASAGWKDVGAPKPDRVTGHTYAHGALRARGGPIFVYAYCVLPGKPAIAK